MKKVPFKTHIINFILKYSLFLIGFFIFSTLELLILPTIYLVLLPLFFTIIGVIADWIVVPKYHNIPSAIAGAVFMGIVTYILPFIFNVGNISIISAILLAIYLGFIEVTLHRFIVKPYL